MNESPRHSEGLSLPALILLCGTIILAAYLIGNHKPTFQPRRLWIPAVVDKNGGVTVLDETRQMNFWTPSLRTKEYLMQGGATNSPDQWQVLSNDEPILRFGMMLHSNASVFGYRRTEVWGHGRSFFKPGWWWSVNVATNFSATDMGRVYQDFWKCKTPVFIEVVESRGSDPQALP